MDQLRQRIRETPGTDIVERLDRVVVAQVRARVDDLLAAPLHFGVVALHTGEVEVCRPGAGYLTACSPSTKTDEQARSS